MSMPGRFLVVEGIEGAGKSTQAAELARWLDGRLATHGIKLVRTREPGGAPFAERVREALLAPSDAPVAPLAELLAMFAARADHLDQTIRPALASGHWVLCDRFTDASYAYQGAGRKLGAEPVALLEALVQQDTRPDLMLLIDVSPAVGLARSSKRGALDRIEQESLEFFARVRDGYLARARELAERAAQIDGEAPLARVQAQLRAALLRAASRWGVVLGAPD